MKIRANAQKHQILVENLAGLGFGERIYAVLTLRSIQFCHANNKQVIMRCCSYNYGLIVRVMFGNFAMIGKDAAAFNF
jgi:hypothetical protein